MGIAIVAALIGTCSTPPSTLDQVLELGELRVVSRNTPTSYFVGPNGPAGPEYDLVQEGLDRFVQPSDTRIAPRLRAVLDDDTVFLLRFDDHASLNAIMAHRLFDIDMLASLRAPDRDQRVPMIGRGDRNGIDALVFQRLADVVEPFGRELALGSAFGGPHRAGQHVVVRIDEVSDLDVILFRPAIDMGFAAAVQTSHRDANAVIRAENFARRPGAGEEQRRAGGSRRGLNEPTTIDT